MPNKRKRREQLFSAEMMLVRALKHLLSAAAWARRMQDAREQETQGDAFEILLHCHQLVVEEQKELR